MKTSKKNWPYSKSIKKQNLIKVKKSMSRQMNYSKESWISLKEVNFKILILVSIFCKSNDVSNKIPLRNSRLAQNEISLNNIQKADTYLQKAITNTDFSKKENLINGNFQNLFLLHLKTDVEKVFLGI